MFIYSFIVFGQTKNKENPLVRFLLEVVPELVEFHRFGGRPSATFLNQLIIKYILITQAGRSPSDSVGALA